MVYQNGEQDCGKASVRNLLSLLFHNEDYGMMPIQSPCCDFAQMQAECQQAGVTLLGIQCPDIQEMEPKDFPALCQVRQGENFHFVVVKRVGFGKVFLLDSQFGELHLSPKEFADISTGRMLIVKDLPAKPLKPVPAFFAPGEILVYFLEFLFQSVLLFSLFFLMDKEGYYPLKISLGILFLILVLTQNLLTSLVKKRMDREILLPYLEVSQCPRDYALLEGILIDCLGRASELVTYSVCASLACYLLFANGLFVSLLGILALLFPIGRALSRPFINHMNQLASLKETSLTDKLSRGEDFKADYEDSLKTAGKVRGRWVSSLVLETGLFSVLILSQMTFVQENTLNYYLFYLFLAFSFSALADQLLAAYRREDRILTQVNGLSYPLPSFFVKKGFPLGYTIMKRGGLSDEGNVSDSGLSGQNPSAVISAKDLPHRLQTYPGLAREDRDL